MAAVVPTSPRYHDRLCHEHHILSCTAWYKNDNMKRAALTPTTLSTSQRGAVACCR